VEWWMLPENPVKKLKMLKEPERRVRFLWRDELPRLLACLAW